MRYTFGSTLPTSSSGTLIAASSGTVSVTPTAEGRTLNVIAFKAGMTDSEVHSATYYYESGNFADPGSTSSSDSGGESELADAALLGAENGQPGYDPNGNLTHYKGWVYTYDAQNRLRMAHNNGTLVATYYYDGKNRQIARSINNVIRFSVWDGWELIEEYGSVRAAAYLQGATGVIKSWTPSSVIYCYQDKLGSTTHVANASGALLESYRYDLYGSPSYFNSTSQPLTSSTYNVVDLYAGERWIPELALYDLRNRFMSSELGRFLQADPIGFKGDASNLYRYCGNDSMNRTDPTGLLDTMATIANRLAWRESGSTKTAAEFDKDRQPAGVDSPKQEFYSAIRNFQNRENRGKGISPQQAVDTGVDDAREAERLVRGDLRRNTRTGRKYGVERGSSEFVDGKRFEKGGPKIGVDDEYNPRVELPTAPESGKDLGPRFMGIHAHGPQSGRSFDRDDIPSSEGRFGNSPYISVVASTHDHGKDVHFHVPGYGTWSTSDGGATFRAGN
jgi:RHS repeat-associated protein